MILTGNNPIDAGERTPAKEFLLTLPSKHLIDFKCSFNAKNCISTTDINDISIIEIVDDISISAPTRGATMFSTGIATAVKFQSTLPQGERQQLSTKKNSHHQIILYIYTNFYFLISDMHIFFANNDIFVHFSKCESPSTFMCNSHPHLLFLIIISKVGLPQSPFQYRHVLPYRYSYFLNNKNVNYPPFHQ